MGLFSKKPPCPICGSKISWFLPTKIEGEYICDDCNGKIDMEDDIKAGLTMQGLREYLVFYEQNLSLRFSFAVSERVDVGEDVIFDLEQNRFCLSRKPDKTVFDGSALKSFRITEDSVPLFEGSAQGLVRHISTVPERAAAMGPQIQMMLQTQRMNDQMERMNDKDDNHSHYRPRIDIPEPFRLFHVELRLDHPYWHTFRCNLSGPTFSNNFPDINDYLQEYQEDAERMERMALLLMQVAFPGVGETGAVLPAGTVSNPPQAGRTADDIKKFKELMDAGVITQAEFDAKKKQLLGI